MVRPPPPSSQGLLDRLLSSDFLVLVTFLIVFLLVVDRRVAPPPPWEDAAPANAGAAGGTGGAGAQLAMAPDPENGKSLFGQTCTACHGASAQGLPHQGVDLRTSKFIAEMDDSQLLRFLKTGRQPKDPRSQRGLLMPALGGNPSLVEIELKDIVAFLRQVQKEASAKPAPTSRPSLTMVAPTGAGASTEER
jgi:mono/diheme cytochrome c family protein